jgi:hypothetical protein
MLLGRPRKYFPQKNHAESGERNEYQELPQTEKVEHGKRQRRRQRAQ